MKARVVDLLYAFITLACFAAIGAMYAWRG
jgi:hypothetical protein